MVTIRNFFLAYRTVILSFVSIVFLVIVSGCQSTTTVHAYDGEPLLKEQIARITWEEREETFWHKVTSSYPCFIVVIEVDGKHFRDYVEGCIHVPEEVFVLPGYHTFGTKFGGSGAMQSGLIPALIIKSIEEKKYGPLGCELEFDVEAGHEYIIRFKEEEKPWKGIVSVAYWVEDVGTGEVITSMKVGGKE